MLIFILMSLVFLIVILLLIPIKVTVSSNQQFIFKLNYLFLNFDLSDESQHKNFKKNKKTPKEKEKKHVFKRIIKENGIKGSALFARKTAAIGLDLIIKIWRHVKIDKFCFNLAIGGEDAASAGIAFGKVCASVYPIFGLIFAKKNKKKLKINIYPDFNSQEVYKIELYCKMSICPCAILFIAIYELIRFGLLAASFKKAGQGRHSKSKNREELKI